MNLSCFKAYDIRGKVPEELDAELAYKIGRAFVEVVSPSSVVVGRDVRLESDMLADAVMKGIVDAGVDVFDIGLCGTEEVYFATSHYEAGGGIMITASHNPKGYNGMKLVQENSKPVSGDTGLLDIKELVSVNKFSDFSRKNGKIIEKYSKKSYIDFLVRYVDINQLEGLKIVTNAGNGCAGPIVDLLEKELAVEFIKVNNEPDGNFPNGIPNPLLPDKREATAQAVRESGADIGLAWDGDFDRCFLFDENGEFIEGYYIVALIAEAILKDMPGESIIHDPRLTWNTIECVEKAAGKPVMTKTGHAFIKERMRKEDAVYGGEMSAHHYFRDFFYCDSGMLPWLYVISLMKKKGMKLSDMTRQMMVNFPVSGEINTVVNDPDEVISVITEKYKDGSLSIDYTDGVSIDFSDWRFNLRKSNTEPVIRLNVETRGDKTLMETKRDELLGLLNSFS